MLFRVPFQVLATYTAYFHFNRNTEMAKEIYDKIVKELYG